MHLYGKYTNIEIVSNEKTNFTDYKEGITFYPCVIFSISLAWNPKAELI